MARWLVMHMWCVASCVQHRCLVVNMHAALGCLPRQATSLAVLHVVHHCSCAAFPGAPAYRRHAWCLHAARSGFGMCILAPECFAV